MYIPGEKILYTWRKTAKQQTWRERSVPGEREKTKLTCRENFTWREKEKQQTWRDGVAVDGEKKTVESGALFLGLQASGCIFLCIRITESCTTADTQTMGHTHTHEIWKQPNNYAGVFSVSMTRTSIQEYIRKESGIITANRQRIQEDHEHYLVFCWISANRQHKSGQIQRITFSC